jgi:hypothetical protein
MRGLNDRTKNSLIVAFRNGVILAIFKPESSTKSMDPDVYDNFKKAALEMEGSRQIRIRLSQGHPALEVFH